MRRRSLRTHRGGHQRAEKAAPAEIVRHPAEALHHDVLPAGTASAPRFPVTAHDYRALPSLATPCTLRARRGKETGDERPSAPIAVRGRRRLDPDGAHAGTRPLGEAVRHAGRTAEPALLPGAARRVRLPHQPHHARRLYQPAGQGARRCGQPGADQHHALLLAQFAAGRRDRTAGLCRRRRRGRFRRSRPARRDRADRRHRQPRPGRARLAGRRGRPDADQPARAPARDVRLAGLGQSVGRDAVRPAHHRGVHRVERRRQRVARTPGARRATEGDAACRGRYRLAPDADPGRRDRRTRRGRSVHPVTPAITTPGTTA